MAARKPRQQDPEVRPGTRGYKSERFLAREARAEEHEKMRGPRAAERLKANRKKFTVVKALKHYKNYNADEVFGVTPSEAAIAIEQSFVVAIDGAEPSMEEAIDLESQTSEHIALIREIRKTLEGMDPEDDTLWEMLPGDGDDAEPTRVPKLDVLNTRVGMTVTAADRAEALVVEE